MQTSSITDTCQHHRSIAGIRTQYVKRCSVLEVSWCLFCLFDIHWPVALFLKEIIVRERQQEINRAATRADGASFQRDLARKAHWRYDSSPKLVNYSYHCASPWSFMPMLPRWFPKVLCLTSDNNLISLFHFCIMILVFWGIKTELFWCFLCHCSFCRYYVKHFFREHKDGGGEGRALYKPWAIA